MNELTDEQINKLNCIWFESDDNVDSYCIANDSVLDFARAVIAADRVLRQAGQEPVAWMREVGSKLFSVAAHEKWGSGNVPLYAAPASVPMTKEEVRELFGELYPNDVGILELAENNRDYALEAIGARHHWQAFEAGVRAIEAAHSIEVVKL